MENCSLQSSAIATIPKSSTKQAFIDRNCVRRHLLGFPSFNKSPQSLKILHVKARASGKGAAGIARFSSQAVEASQKEVDLKDENLAFVAGATGKVGSRAVRELLKLGFRVRAGVRSAQRAGSLVQSVKEMKTDTEGAQPVEKLEIVECDLEKPSQIGPALGNASVVLCCIGASEKEVFDITGPYRIDYLATKNLIDAATVAKVKHFIMVSSLGTNKVGFPAAVLNLFWGVLIWKRKAEEALIASGLPYTIVRPGGMERPTDAFKETHNMILKEEDTLFGGLVSNLQVAELIAFMAKNRSLSYCKVVEVIAETTAPLTPMDKLLSKIPSQRVEPKDSDAADIPVKNVVPVTSSPPIEQEPQQAKAIVTKPLSPYYVYEDLKPPTSPTPTQPSGKKEAINAVDAVSIPEVVPGDVATKPTPVEAKIERPLSPYAAYEDLKPPTSPTPTQSTGKNEVVDAVSSPAVAPGDVATKPPPVEAKIERPLSPYAAYDDLKPPTSPTPSTPVVSTIPTSSLKGGPETGNGAPSPAPSDTQQHIEAKPRPLSPYTMYEDMKPPTSPIPSPRKPN